MSLLHQLSQLESDLTEKDAILREAGEATHYLADVLTRDNARFWALPTDRLLAVLNEDVARTLATFEANTLLAQQVNASLDTLGVAEFSKRAPVVPGRSDIVYNGEVFVFVAPQE